MMPQTAQLAKNAVITLVSRNACVLLSAFSLGITQIAAAADVMLEVEFSAVQVLDLSLESQQNWLPPSWLMAEPYVQIDVSTDSNLVVLARQHHWLLNPFVARCRNGKFDPAARLTEALGVRDDVGIIAFERLANTSDTGTTSAPPFKYRFYFRIASYGDSPLHTYDLRTTPIDICFYLGATDADGRKVVSNLVGVPKDELQRAIGDFDGARTVP